MTDKDRLKRLIDELPDAAAGELLDFAEFLRYKQARAGVLGDVGTVNLPNHQPAGREQEGFRPAVLGGEAFEVLDAAVGAVGAARSRRTGVRTPPTLRGLDPSQVG